MIAGFFLSRAGKEFLEINKRKANNPIKKKKTWQMTIHEKENASHFQRENLLNDMQFEMQQTIQGFMKFCLY